MEVFFDEIIINKKYIDIYSKIRFKKLHINIIKGERYRSTEKENKFDEFDKYYDTYDLTSEELSYYLEVQSRVLKKLLEIQ